MQALAQVAAQAAQAVFDQLGQRQRFPRAAAAEVARILGDDALQLLQALADAAQFAARFRQQIGLLVDFLRQQLRDFHLAMVRNVLRVQLLQQHVHAGDVRAVEQLQGLVDVFLQRFQRALQILQHATGHLVGAGAVAFVVQAMPGFLQPQQHAVEFVGEFADFVFAAQIEAFGLLLLAGDALRVPGDLHDRPQHAAVEQPGEQGGDEETGDGDAEHRGFQRAVAAPADVARRVDDQIEQRAPGKAEQGGARADDVGQHLHLEAAVGQLQAGAAAGDGARFGALGLLQLDAQLRLLRDQLHVLLIEETAHDQGAAARAAAVRTQDRHAHRQHRPTRGVQQPVAQVALVFAREQRVVGRQPGLGEFVEREGHRAGEIHAARPDLRAVDIVISQQIDLQIALVVLAEIRRDVLLVAIGHVVVAIVPVAPILHRRRQ